MNTSDSKAVDKKEKLLDINQFCEINNISRTTFYALKNDGLAPKFMRIGRKTLISPEANEEWRKKMEQLAAAA